MTYAYALPLHMGGRRRSSRVIQQEMMEDQNKIVNLMRKFPLGSLFQGWTAKRSPATTSQKTTTRATPQSQTCNPTIVPQQQAGVRSVTRPLKPASTRLQMPDAAVASTTATTDRPKLTPAKRRRQIQFAYELLGTPPEWITPQAATEPINQWKGKDGVIRLISDYLLWSKTWRTTQMIRRVLEFVQSKLEAGDDLNDIAAGVSSYIFCRKKKTSRECTVCSSYEDFFPWDLEVCTCDDN